MIIADPCVGDFLAFVRPIGTDLDDGR